MIKLVDNAQRDVLFGLSNEVARIADTIGVSVTETIRAGRLGYARSFICQCQVRWAGLVSKRIRLFSQAV